MPQNLIEKIAHQFAVGLAPGHEVRSGDYLSIRPAHVLTHDNTGAVIPKFRGVGAVRVADPRQPVFALDHDIQNRAADNLAKYARIAAFAREHGIDFYPAGRGIGHQVMCEEGYAWPGTMVVASDSHANMYGGLGCLGTPIVRTDAAAIWATGRTWWQVPPVARVELRGRLSPGATGKDVIITLCGLFNHDEVLNHAVEFTGDGIGALSIDERLTIANMTTEWGALAGVFPVDAVTLAWLRARAVTLAGRAAAAPGGVHPRMTTARIDALASSPVAADADSTCAVDLVLDLSTVQPWVSGPDTVKVAAPASDLARQDVAIHKAYLLSCVNGRVEDFAAAAAVLRGRTVAAGVTLYVAAASSEVQRESEARGDWQALVEAGAVVLPPGCGPCIGMGEGLLADGEVGISATNRNFKGRMGSRNAKAYLGSPAVVAASAIAGRIALPDGPAGEPAAPRVEVRRSATARRDAVGVPIIEGFPARLTGPLLFCHQDNLNTDGIYAGKYTYKDDMTPAQQAAVVMENYDPAFRSLLRPGDLLAGGFNFGTGSSREQAATSLKHAGIRLVIAGSFNETYKRNALNNGLLVLEAPDLVRDLKTRFGAASATVRTGIEATLDFTASVIEAGDRRYRFDPVGAAAQELIVVGGLEAWVGLRMREEA